MRRRIERALGAYGWVAALALSGALTGACSKSPSAPTDPGVNITVDAKALSATQLGVIKRGLLLVSGADTQAQQFTVVPAISTGTLTFRYLPKAASGMFSFEFDALDIQDRVLGTGTAGPITVAAGGVASVTITLKTSPGTSKSLGANCTTTAECGSGFCVDGVCCDTACTDVCANCALKDTTGLCSPYAAGTDPEGECTGAPGTPGTGGSGGKGGAAGGGPGGSAVDGGSPDAEQINPPDGGIVAMAIKCGGTCSGAMHCGGFADGGTSCGNAFCNTHQELAAPVCDGKGTCGIALSTCTNGYGCDQTAKPNAMCHASCNANGDCDAKYYCNGTTNMCAQTKADGLTCATDAECLHGHCAGAGTGVSGICCNTACPSPLTCNASGSVGTCSCPGMKCTAGVACVAFYPDGDGDGFGDKTATVNNGKAMAACANAPPPGFVADNTDCDDGDMNVYPGQTAYFSTPSKGIGTYDYNCDGMKEKGIPEYPGATCAFCPNACTGNGCTDPVSGTCASTNEVASLACPREGGICPIIILPPVSAATSTVQIAASIVVPPVNISVACCGCSALDQAGFTTTVDCFVSSNTYTTCGTCGAASGVIGSSSGGKPNGVTSKVQTCH
jgi:hypothetical protein